jgi:hypothetical protein
VNVLYARDGTTRRHGSSGISFRSIRRQCYCRCMTGARFAPNIPQAQKSFWTVMVLLCDEGQVEALFSSLVDSANLDARWVHGL